jgi:hypothetical protein
MIRFLLDSENRKKNPGSWVPLVLRWENIPHTYIDTPTNAVSFYHTQFHHPTDVIDDLWYKISEPVRTEILEGNVYWLLSNAHEAELQTTLNALDLLAERNGISRTKIILVTGAAQPQDYNGIRVLYMNMWQSNMREIWRHKYNEPHDISLESASISFICLNRNVRYHRVALLGMLQDRKLLDDNIVSCHVSFDGKDLTQEFIKFANEDLKRGLYSRQAHTELLKRIPIVADAHQVKGLTTLTEFTEKLHLKAFFSVVTETHFFSEPIFLTEKTYRPMIHGRPFLIATTAGHLKEVRRSGFETFPEIFNEEYDTIEDSYKRIEAIANETARIAAQPIRLKQQMLEKVKDKLLHNQNRFFSPNPPVAFVESLNRIANEH